jgi:hypothetical protein
MQDKYPTMTRQHFQFIADVIAELCFEDGASNYRNRVQLVQKFTDELKHTNPNFKPGTFVEACVMSLDSIKGIN